jgi:hypothetical protein
MHKNARKVIVRRKLKKRPAYTRNSPRPVDDSILTTPGQQISITRTFFDRSDIDKDRWGNAAKSNGIGFTRMNDLASAESWSTTDERRLTSRPDT